MTPIAVKFRLAAALALALIGTVTLAEELRRNVFDDPFVQATGRIPNCPVAEGPRVTPAEARSQAHYRVERGTSCYQEGRCRLPNSYDYDREIVPRVVDLIRTDRRFSKSTVWVLGQRRWVFLKGCVVSARQATRLEREVRRMADVESVINQLMVGTRRRPPYIVEH